MRLLYDGEIYSMQAAGGINRYFASLIGRLPASFNPTLLAAKTCEINQPVHPRLKIYGRQKLDLRNFSTRLDSYHSRLRSGCLQTFVDSHRFDIAHPTYYRLLTRRDLSAYRCPVVLTVWDLIHELFPRQMDPRGHAAELKRKALEAAQAIICISENTKKDLLEYYRVPEAKVKVILLASEIDVDLSYGPETVPSRPYYLYVGSRSRHKNFNGLLAAFGKAVSVRPEMALCVVGEPFVESEKRVICDLKLTNYIEHYRFTSDAHLAKLYRHSLALVYPSLYEGFGLPPLEAMSCGTTVVASNVASIPEVVDDAGLLFDPASTDELADRLLFLLNNPAERERLIAKGRERARAFSWNKTVAETLQIYRSLGNPARS